MLMSSASGSSSCSGSGCSAQEVDHADEHRARLRVDLSAEGLDLLPAAGVAEQHPPGVGVLGDVGDPDLEHRAQALLHRPGRRDGGGERREVVAVALEQREVEGALVGEVAVEDRLRDADRGGDVVEPRAVVAPDAEEEPRGIQDQRAPLVREVGRRLVVTRE